MSLIINPFTFISLAPSGPAEIFKADFTGADGTVLNSSYVPNIGPNWVNPVHNLGADGFLAIRSNQVRCEGATFGTRQPSYTITMPVAYHNPTIIDYKMTISFYALWGEAGKFLAYGCGMANTGSTRSQVSVYWPGGSAVATVSPNWVNSTQLNECRVTYDGSNIRYYFRGLLIYTKAWTGALTTNTLYIHLTEADNYYYTYLDSISLWVNGFRP